MLHGIILILLFFPALVFAEINIENEILNFLVKSRGIESKGEELDVKVDLSKIMMSKAQVLDVKFTRLDKSSKNFELEASLDNNQVIALRGRYDIFKEVPVVRNNLKRGDEIKYEDIDLAKINKNLINSNFITDENELHGKIAKSSLIAYKPIMRTSISRPIIINKKDMITAKYEKNNISLQLVVEALDEGGTGDMIRVMNPKSKAVFSGIIEDNRTIKIITR